MLRRQLMIPCRFVPINFLQRVSIALKVRCAGARGFGVPTPFAAEEKECRAGYEGDTADSADDTAGYGARVAGRGGGGG
ncbi:MAG: hypothetical protein Q9188_007438 [Gyalolechia gomerana]